MSLKAKIEAVIYASEEPVTLQQLMGLLGEEAQAELDAADARQGQLALLETETVVVVQEVEAGDPDALNAETLGTDVFAAVAPLEAEMGGEWEEAEPSGEVPRAGGAEVPGEEAAAAVSPAAEASPAALRARERRLREFLRAVLDGLVAESAEGDRGLCGRLRAGTGWGRSPSTMPRCGGL